MARARNIKPGFFSNDVLAECDPLARLLFAGMWTIADRCGRMEDRPKRIKAEVLPYDTCDVEALLVQLAERGFILRYSHGGARYIQVQNFEKHQNPHCKEQESSIPAPEKHGASTVQVRCKNSNSTEVAGLIPDSGYLIPDSTATEADASVVAGPADDDSAAAKIDRLPDCPQQEIIALYAESLPDLPQPVAWEGARANNLRARWRWVLTDKLRKGKPHDREAGIDFFRRMFAYVAGIDFLCGRTSAWKGCDLGWLVKAENFAKVIAGNYDQERAA